MDQPAHLNPLLQAVGVPPAVQMLYMIAVELDALSLELPDAPITIDKIKWEAPPISVQKCIQLLTLAVLSMWGGAMATPIKRVQYKGAQISLTWESGITDHFTMGVLDKAFIHFLKASQIQVWNRVVSKGPSALLMYEWLQLIAQHSHLLTRCQECIETLLSGDLSVISAQASRIDFMFVVISALPVAQLNHLFLYLYQFLPTDLTIKSPEGNQIHVGSLFGAPSQDFRFLVQKSKVFLQLYTSPETPIIQMITQAKTSDYLVDILSKDGQLSKIKTQVEDIRDRQIITRLRLYYAMTTLLNKVVKT